MTKLAKKKLPRVRLKMGPVRIWTPGGGAGYRARCTVAGCTWRAGGRNSGDYVWRVQDKALAHIVAAHERRKRERRKHERRKGERRQIGPGSTAAIELKWIAPPSYTRKEAT